MKVKNRIIAIILGILMLSGMMPAVAVHAAWPTESWQDSGIPDTQWHTDQTAAGQGSSGNPFIIDTAEELAGLASLANGGNTFANQYIKLGADIDLAGKEWVPIGTNDSHFSGIFDGDSHVISNLTIYTESNGCAGLFGNMGLYWGTCGIKNLGVVDVNIGGEVRYGGAMAGYVANNGFYKHAVFDNCFATGSISSESLHAQLGGLFGSIDIANTDNSSITVSNSYTACNISAVSTDNQIYYTRFVGGMFGKIERFGNPNTTLAINNSYSASRVYSANLERTRIGGFTGYVNTTNQITMTNCMFDTQAAGIGYGFSSAGVSFAGVAEKRTSEMTGILPSEWNTSVWQAEADLYPQPKSFSDSASSTVSGSSLVGALPLFLFENLTVPELSDTRANVRRSFTVPVIIDVNWSATPDGILEFSDGEVAFTSPASDTEVTVTATHTSGAKKEFTVLCKSGVNPADSTPPVITIGDITPLDFSASIPVTSDENADLYVLVRLSSEGAPNAGDIIASGSTVQGSGTEFTASVGSLQHSTAYTAYTIGADATGNVSDVVSKPFTTLQDQTPPSWQSHEYITVSGGIASFHCEFSEVGTFKYVVLPAVQTAPDKNQVAAGWDASGSPADYSGNHGYSGGYAAVAIDISSYVPNQYQVYLVCEDAYGNISNVLNSGLGFEIKGNVTFTVTDGADPIEGAEVTTGTATVTTDANGQAVISSLSGGSYTYTITSEGYNDASDSFEMDVQEKSVNVALTPIISASIFPVTCGFDLYSPDDVETTVTWNSAGAVSDIKAGGISIGAGNYSVSGDILAIKKEYITTQSTDSLVLTVEFDIGEPAALVIDITDTTPPYINPIEINFDLNSPADVSTVITWNSAQTVTEVVYGSDALIMPDTYTVIGSTLTIKADYLSAQGISEGDSMVFEIGFNTGDTAALTVHFVNGYIPSSNADLSVLTVGGSMVSSFDPNTFFYNMELPYGTQPGSAAASVSATADEPHAQVSITQASDIPGSASVLVTAEDTTTTKIYTINFTLGAAPIAHSITVQNDGHGTGSAIPTTAAQGATITLSSTPNSGCHFKEWQVISPESLTITGNTFTMPDEAVTVKAIFEADEITNYTVTFNSNGSVYAVKTVQAGTSIGSANWPANPTMPGYTFGGWYTGANGSGSEFTSATAVTETITVYAKWTADSDGSGDDDDNSDDDSDVSSGGGSIPSAPAYTADVKADNGESPALPVNVDKDTGNAAVNLDAQGGDNIAGGGSVSISIPAIPDVNSYTVEIPADYLSSSKAGGILTLNTDTGSIALPSNMLTTLEGAAGKNANITIGEADKNSLPGDVKADIGDRPVIQLTLSVNGQQAEWSNPDAPVTVSIPYTPTAAELLNPESIVVWYIDGSGKLISVPNGRYDPAAGTVTFSTTHFSDYAVGFNKVRFNDVMVGAWYNKAVGFIAARGITGGTGGGNYSPEARLTRGEFIVMLMKAYDIAPDTNPKDNFSDAGNTYYTGYLAAAKRLSISDGAGNNMFAPEKAITRQEMFTLLYNTLKSINKLPRGNSGMTLSGFTDAGQVDSWSKDAMTLLVETGTISGSGGTLNPANTATRAEMAQLLYNLMSK